MTKISCKSFYSLLLLQVCALRNECNWGVFYIWMRKSPLRKLVRWRSYLAWRKAHFLLKILPLLWSPMEVLVSPETRFEEDPWTVFYFRLFHILPILFISYLFLCFFVLALCAVDLLLQNGSFCEICSSSAYGSLRIHFLLSCYKD